MKPESSNLKTIIIWTIIFSIAMGFLEAAVVVYLRQLYYPAGFTFPLQSMALPALKIEFLRELATIWSCSAVLALLLEENCIPDLFFLC